LSKQGAETSLSYATKDGGMSSTETSQITDPSSGLSDLKCTPQTRSINQQINQPKKPTYRENQTMTKTTPLVKRSISKTHQWLSTQQAREAHTEKNENSRHPSLLQRDNTVPLLLFLHNNRRAWHPQQSPPQPPPLEPPPLQQLPLQQPLQQHPQELLHPLPLELTNALETLWQPPSEGQALGLHLKAEAAAEEEVEEEAEEAVAEVEEEGEEVVAEDNQPLSLLNSSSPLPQQPTYTTWEPSLESSKEKETRQMPL
jgi:hypothetical protein